MAHLLLVEDDAGVRQALSLALRALGHHVSTAEDGQDAVHSLSPGHRVDVVLLDVMMPGLDGFATCREIRRSQGVPIIMLTARGDAVDIVAGLECGADDYVVKPVEPRVLDARIKAVLRRVQDDRETPLLTVGDLQINLDAMTAARAGVPLGLTALELKLLVTLARNAGQVLTRAVLLDRVWEYDYSGDARLVDAAIQRLRSKIETDPAHPRLIHTVRGVGYRLDAS